MDGLLLFRDASNTAILQNCLDPEGRSTTRPWLLLFSLSVCGGMMLDDVTLQGGSLRVVVETS
jgi:hypothetical protein